MMEKGFTTFLVAACVYTTFFAAYLGSSFIGYGLAMLLIIFRLTRLRLTTFQTLSIALLAAYVLIVLINTGSAGAVLQNIRFWYGFVIYLLFFKVCEDSRLATPRFFYLVCAMVILEAILVNTVISPELIYGVDKKGEFVRFYSFYQRPLSFAGNASMSAGALIVLYSIVDLLNPGKLRLRDLGVLLSCTIVFMSATGFLLFLLFLCLKALREKNISWQGVITWATTLAAIVGAYFVSVMIQAKDFQQGSFAYLQQLFYLKYYSVVFLFMRERTLTDFLLGLQVYSDLPTTSGDFGWLIFIMTCGFFGLTVFALLVSAFYRPKVSLLLCLFLLLIGVVHYPIAMSQAGQLLLAFILVGSASAKQIVSKT